MENLLNSRLNRDSSPSKLEGLSPEKFGKAAFAGLTYTPSRLADNILFKEVSTMKKVEEESSKARESETLNIILKDRISQMIEERDGIEETLTKQMLMYKKMLNENEIRHQNRVKDIQRSFKEEIQILIADKQEEAKYIQSQKELLEDKIQSLEAENNQLRQKLNHGGNTFDQLTRQHEKLEIHFKNTSEKLQKTQQEMKKQNENSKKQIQDLNKKFIDLQTDFKNRIKKLELEQEKEIEQMQSQHRKQLQKVQNKRIQEVSQRTQQLKNLTTTFQTEAERLKGIINEKQKSIYNLTNNLDEQKQKILNLTRTNTAEITSLIHEKGRLNEEVENLNIQIERLKESQRISEQKNYQDILDRESVIERLKQQLQLTQISFVREKDRTSLLVDDLKKQISILTVNQKKNDLVMNQNAVLCREINNLKDLLLESSLEMEKCKEQFLRIGREKDHLAVKVRELGYENQTLNRIKYQKEEQAKGWRDSYYMSRR